MRINEDCVQFAKDFIKSGKPVAAICHGPQLLIETGLLKGRKMTSYSSIRTDLINAGANWKDKEVIVDNGLVTSRSPKDLEAFNKKIVEEVSEGIISQRRFTVKVYSLYKFRPAVERRALLIFFIKLYNIFLSPSVRIPLLSCISKWRLNASIAAEAIFN